MRIKTICLSAALVGALVSSPAQADSLMQTASLLQNLSRMNTATIGTRGGSPKGSVENLFGAAPVQAKPQLVYVAFGGQASSGWGTTSFGTTSFGTTSFGTTSFGHTSMGQTSMGQTSMGTAVFGRH